MVFSKADRPIVFDDEEEIDEQDEQMTEAEKDVSETTPVPAIEPMAVDSRPIAPTAGTTHNATESETKDVVPNGAVATPTAEDEECTHTPKLEDVSDVEPENNTDKDDEESNGDDINDPARHPASIPHVHPRLTDDEAMDSVGVTPRTEEGDMMLMRDPAQTYGENQAVVTEQAAAGFEPDGSILSAERPNV
ncbi:hypothetical protein EC973_006579 [Apophysomyces ossiformis]|uniref:Uncharacterized protein n=1 Tax=Apophysomyces ossiformis TaxID=679940 RepID=A0A8H7BVD8_9FUNG|nr:hypothetical protein EC973_006579 [Apophysomyces ossiformis]